MRWSRNVAIALLAAVLVSGCDWFSYTTYEARVPIEMRNTTALNLQRIKTMSGNGEASFTFAVFSDPHYLYDDVADAVKSLNQNPEIKFVLVTGDLTDQGLMQEFLSFHDAMQKLNKPYLTVIGNHDYLSNGEEVYRQMFGPYNYTFSYNGVKFVMWDNVFWENERDPDFQWLEYQLQSDYEHDATIVASHIPPFGDQFTESDAERYHQAVLANATLSIHGHNHIYYEGNYYHDGMRYLVLPWLKERQYCEVTVGLETGLQTKMVSY